MGMNCVRRRHDLAFAFHGDPSAGVTSRIWKLCTQTARRGHALSSGRETPRKSWRSGKIGRIRSMSFAADQTGIGLVVASSTLHLFFARHGIMRKRLATRSPDFDQLEKFPAGLRPCCAKPAPNRLRTVGLIGRLLDLFQPNDCANYFSSCGYQPE